MSVELDAIECGSLKFDFLKDRSEVATFLDQSVFQVAGKVIQSLGVHAKGYYPNCPPNFQTPVCWNQHTAIYVAWNQRGKFHAFLCERHGCDYQYHNFIRKFMPPGFTITGVEKNRNYWNDVEDK
jgi:hypothetical protein